MPTKILAIDDSKTMRLAIKITFAAEDAEVVAVSKGSEAVARAKQMGADVVLVDHTLAAGEPSGQEVCAALKADPATAGIPIIALIPAKGGPDPSTAASWGAEIVVQKPFDTQDLIDRVASVAGKPAAAKPTAAAAAPAPKPAVAPPPGTPVAAAPAPGRPPAAAAKPAAAPAPSPTPAAKPRPGGLPNLGSTRTPGKPPAGPAAKPAPTPAAKPPSGPKPVASPQPAPRPAVQPAAGAAGDIPIAIPIPFTAANAPSSGMLERLKAAQAQGGAAAGLDPQALQALLALTHEVIEQVVWEVVPELAEELIKQKSQ